MAVQSFSCIDGDCSTTANFRAWGSAVSAAIQALGTLTKTSDTGQINWATVNAALAGNAAGYEMYALTDSLQATAPVYIKIEYGTGSTTPKPGIWVTVGTATDGAGTLTSLANTGVSVSSRIAVSTANSASGTSKPCIVNGDSSSLMVMLWNGSVTNVFFLIERVRAADGTPSADAVTVAAVVSSTGINWQSVYIHNQVAQPGVQATGLAIVAPGATTGIKDSVMATYPWCTGSGPRTGAPSKFLITHVAADLSALATFSCTHYGSSHNWVSLTNPRGTGLGLGGGIVSGSLALAARTD